MNRSNPANQGSALAAQPKVGENRKSYLDVLRILACALVILNHLPGDELFRSADGAMLWVYLFITDFTRINVPIFFMISGALLLPREEPLSKVLKRIARVVVVLVVFGTVMYIAYDPWAATLSGCLKGLLMGNITFAYWYLYAYLGFLVMLPFLRMVARNFGCLEFRYILLLHICFVTLWRVGGAVISWNSDTSVYLSSDFSIPLATTKAFFYPLMGYYLDRVFRVEDLKKRDIALLSAGAVLGILVTSAVTYVDGAITGEMTERYTDLFAWLTAMVVFVVVKYLFVTAKKQMGVRTGKLLGFVSSLTFGIYLLDPLLQHWILWPFMDNAPVLPTMVISLGWCVFSMCLGGLITYLLKKAAVLL